MIHVADLVKIWKTKSLFSQFIRQLISFCLFLNFLKRFLEQFFAGKIIYFLLQFKILNISCPQSYPNLCVIFGFASRFIETCFKHSWRIPEAYFNSLRTCHPTSPQNPYLTSYPTIHWKFYQTSIQPSHPPSFLPNISPNITWPILLPNSPSQLLTKYLNQPKYQPYLT